MAYLQLITALMPVLAVFLLLVVFGAGLNGAELT
tara:strand:+ start:31169 stop:31270 length:102 start_codon:yes stop_codon:yes gene_type:complete